MYDELVFEIKEECVDDYKVEICKLMLEVVIFDVLLIVEVDSGDNW